RFICSRGYCANNLEGNCCADRRSEPPTTWETEYGGVRFPADRQPHLSLHQRRHRVTGDYQDTLMLHEGEVADVREGICSSGSTAGRFDVGPCSPKWAILPSTGDTATCSALELHRDVMTTRPWSRLNQRADRR